MGPFGVVIRQPFLDRYESFVSSSEAFPCADFAFHDRPEGLCRCVVPALRLAAHGTEKAVSFEHSPIGCAVVLRALVRVNNEALLRLRQFQSRLESSHHHRRGHVVCETGPQNSSTAKVYEGRDVRPALVGSDVRDVARPRLVQLPRFELPGHEVLERILRASAIGRGHETPALPTDDPVVTKDGAEPLQPDLYAVVLQVTEDGSDAGDIATRLLSENPLGHLENEGIGTLVLVDGRRGQPVKPREVAADAYPEDSAALLAGDRQIRCQLPGFEHFLDDGVPQIFPVVRYA